MDPHSFAKIIADINTLSKQSEIGSLQNIRKRIQGLQRLPAKDIFTSSSTFDDWACHHGGRKELQFNIGVESTEGAETYIRIGVAFSLQLSQSLPDIDVLLPKIALFNEYLLSNLEKFGGMRMWHVSPDATNLDLNLGPISPELVYEGSFIFLGAVQIVDEFDYELAISTMSRLLPLYLHTETKGEMDQLREHPKREGFTFNAGFSKKVSSTTASPTQKQLNISLRHNVIQEALCLKLSSEYGADNVADEHPNGYGAIDVVLRKDNTYWFYEIKTAHTAKACIREAIGQLLEYSYWPGNQQADRMIIVGEPNLDGETKEYIQALRTRFALPLDYESIDI